MANRGATQEQHEQTRHTLSNETKHETSKKQNEKDKLRTILTAAPLYRRTAGQWECHRVWCSTIRWWSEAEGGAHTWLVMLRACPSRDWCKYQSTITPLSLKTYENSTQKEVGSSKSVLNLFTLRIKNNAQSTDPASRGVAMHPSFGGRDPSQLCTRWQKFEHDRIIVNRQKKTWQQKKCTSSLPLSFVSTECAHNTGQTKTHILPSHDKAIQTSSEPASAKLNQAAWATSPHHLVEGQQHLVTSTGKQCLPLVMSVWSGFCSGTSQVFDLGCAQEQGVQLDTMLATVLPTAVMINIDGRDCSKCGCYRKMCVGIRDLTKQLDVSGCSGTRATRGVLEHLPCEMRRLHRRSTQSISQEKTIISWARWCQSVSCLSRPTTTSYTKMILQRVSGRN